VFVRSHRKLEMHLIVPIVDLTHFGMRFEDRDWRAMKRTSFLLLNCLAVPLLLAAPFCLQWQYQEL
jgi:hypothetical protein